MPMARVAQAPGASAGSSQWSSVLWSLQPSAPVLCHQPCSFLFPWPAGLNLGECSSAACWTLPLPVFSIPCTLLALKSDLVQIPALL